MRISLLENKLAWEKLEIPKEVPINFDLKKIGVHGQKVLLKSSYTLALECKKKKFCVLINDTQVSINQKTKH